VTVANEPPSGSDPPVGPRSPVDRSAGAPADTPVPPPAVSGNGAVAESNHHGQGNGAGPHDASGDTAVWRDPIESVWSPPGEPLELSDTESHADPAGTKGRRARKKSGIRTLVEWALVLGGALAAALVIQATFLKAFYIPSGSMEPTLEINDRVLVNKLSYSFGDVQRGDIIVFHKPENAPDSEVNDFIKRVVALEGDTIESRNGAVYLNGSPVDEGYLDPGTVTLNLPSQQIPPGHIFVMGDNRAHSVDSRVFGPIEEGSIVGEALFRVWPVTDLGRV